MKKKSGTEPLKRLIQLIPVLNANPGISLSELIKITDYSSERDLRRDLEKMIMYGVPPFSPADFIDLIIDGDKIFLEFTPCLDRPLDLTSSEWAAIQDAIAADLKLSSDGGESEKTLKKIQKKISVIPVAFESSPSFHNRRKMIDEAIQDDSQIEFLYRSISSRTPEIRRVDPWAILSHRGISYLIGHCYLRNAARIFHLERVEGIEIVNLPRETPIPEDLDSILSKSPIFNGPSGFNVTVAFLPEIRSAVEYNFFPVKIGSYEGANEAFGGWLQADCPVNESLWFRSMIRSFGNSIVILSPEHMRISFLEELNEIPAIDSAGESLDLQG
ncbi:MAG: WYL domain-containing protein [Spirochaetia bacterium]|nr:WYL domain-containing protein [Spirochaetia bacterium]